MLGKIIVGILALYIAIGIHEYGHAEAMISYGVEVKELSIGIGPALYETTLESGVSVYVRPIIIGGYTMPTNEGSATMQNLSFWTRTDIHLRGILYNLYTAIVLMFFLRLRKPEYYYGYSRTTVMRLPNIVRSLVTTCIDSVVFVITAPVLMVYYFFMQFLPFAGPKNALYERLQNANSMKGTSSLSDIVLMMVLLLASFNLIPVAPLDGSKVFMDILLPYIGQEAADSYMSYSRVVFFLMFFLLPYTPIEYYSELRARSKQA